MNNGIDKKALFKLKSEPYLKPISDLGVGFYNLDENTAILRFQLSNSKGPLLIHENNLTAYAYFESSNGSASDVIELEIEDSFNGIVTVTLDKDFLQASTSTKVKGQVYIGVNNVEGNPEYNEVAVFREFTFEVADALINKISSFTKIEQIRMFSQLKMKIEQKVKDVEEAIANGADYVAEMKSVLQEGIETLNAIVNDGKSDIQTYITQAKTDLTKLKDNATKDITTTANNAKSSVQDTASTAVNSINNKANEATEHVNTKVTEFNQTVEDNGFLTHDKLTEDLATLNWQKYKLTNDDGKSHKLVNAELDNPDFLSNLKTGFYYCPSPTGSPLDKSGFLEVYEYGNNIVKHVFFRPFNLNRIFMKNCHISWSDWKEITNDQSDTGWIPFTIINGGRTNTDYGYGESRNGYGCSYRVITIGSMTQKFVRVNASNVAHEQYIAQLPANITKSPQVGFIRAPLDHNGTSIIVENDGSVKLYVANKDKWEKSDKKYIYGTISWVE
ncbi:BppU family phage baseplate upper protein [Staphylococcus simulans]|uniref:BppU family phage baseplate upper protein n=1 Tax=Staphylococcus simulans TaxID=1286 RepID=UPI000F6FC638|nr:BppU family phage baseplate upper protein [Staphylococcus simulans]VED60504.1 phage protein [Staphylococcus simulans]